MKYFLQMGVIARLSSNTAALLSVDCVAAKLHLHANKGLAPTELANLGPAARSPTKRLGVGIASAPSWGLYGK
jgi:hypothetical protein